MENYNRGLVSAIVRGHELKEVLRGLLEDEINHLLAHELSAYLSYGAYNSKGFNSGNSRNSHYYQPQTISNITKSVDREVKAFRHMSCLLSMP